VRWDRGSKSFTDIDQREVMRFAVDLVSNYYQDPRLQGNLYGKEARRAQQQAAAHRAKNAPLGMWQNFTCRV
jgi:hypothetical protein